MGRQLVKYSFYAIFLYLGVAYSTGAGRLIKEGTTGGGLLIRNFQGRK